MQPPSYRKLHRQQGAIRPKKHLGQHFLVDPNIIKGIIRAGNFSQADTVVEIGPGLGALTQKLAPLVGTLIAIETDKKLYLHLHRTLDYPHVTIIHANVLKFNFSSLPTNIKVIGNLPYNISTPIIEKLILQRNRCQQAWCTVQYEFGKRLAAHPDTKDYGALTCFVQYYCDVRLLFTIKNGAFRPRPKVTSCFIRLDFREPADKAHNEEFLFTIIRNVFQQRRKKIVNALSLLIDKGTSQRILADLHISENKRPENLSLKDYIDFTNAFTKLQSEIKKS